MGNKDQKRREDIPKPVPKAVPNNLLNLLSISKRNESRTEILERKRREYLIKNKPNKMYHQNNNV
jgi:hypothetical protein